MKLLLISQKVDQHDDVLGFFHGWIQAFAEKCDHIEVICLYEGQHSLPANTSVHSLGKEKGFSRIRYIFNFYRLIFSLRKNYDAVFVHMNHRYVLMGWPVWFLYRKIITLWYAHGHTPLLLYPAVLGSHKVFSSTKSGLRIKTSKLRVVGQGIDTDQFSLVSHVPQEIFRILTVGRISPIKDYETLIRAASLLKGTFSFMVEVYGKEGVGSDVSYRRKLGQLLKKEGLEKNFIFAGAISHGKVPTLLPSVDVFVNMSRTGSLDKAVLEAMAAGVPVLTPNEAFIGVLGPLAGSLMYEKGNYRELAQKIGSIRSMSRHERDEIKSELRSIVVQSHDLRKFADAIIKEIFSL